MRKYYKWLFSVNFLKYTNYEQRDNISLVSTKEVEIIVKFFSIKKTTTQDDFTG